jgi:hypothetical protein
MLHLKALDNCFQIEDISLAGIGGQISFLKKEVTAPTEQIIHGLLPNNITTFVT